MIVGSAFTTFFCENSEYLGTRLGEIVQVSLLSLILDLVISNCSHTLGIYSYVAERNSTVAQSLAWRSQTKF